MEPAKGHQSDYVERPAAPLDNASPNISGSLGAGQQLSGTDAKKSSRQPGIKIDLGSLRKDSVVITGDIAQFCEEET